MGILYRYTWQLFFTHDEKDSLGIIRPNRVVAFRTFNLRPPQFPFLSIFARMAESAANPHPVPVKKARVPLPLNITF
jgi:hypothetical protein